MKTGLRTKQKGAAAIEFALVFVVFFAVFYGIVSYSLPLLLMQSFHHSTAEAVRRSVALDPTVSPSTYTADVQARADRAGRTTVVGAHGPEGQRAENSGLQRGCFDGHSQPAVVGAEYGPASAGAAR